jgi:hypothetical protein
MPRLAGSTSSGEPTLNAPEGAKGGQAAAHSASSAVAPIEQTVSDKLAPHDAAPAPYAPDAVARQTSLTGRSTAIPGTNPQAVDR